MTPTKKKLAAAATDCEQLIQNPRKGTIIMSILSDQSVQRKAAAAVELVAGNVRYALARRDFYNADGLCEVLEIDPALAPELYDGGDYTLDQIALLAVFFGVPLAAMFDENLIVSDYDPNAWDRLMSMRELTRPSTP